MLYYSGRLNNVKRPKRLATGADAVYRKKHQSKVYSRLASVTNTLEDAQIQYIASLGNSTVAGLAALMLRMAKVDYQFDAAGSDVRVKEQAPGLAWHGALLANLRALAGLTGLEMVVDGNFVRFVKEERAES